MRTKISSLLYPVNPVILSTLFCSVSPYLMASRLRGVMVS